MDPSLPPYSATQSSHSCQVAFIMGVVIAFVLMAIWNCSMGKLYSGYSNVTSLVDPQTRHRIDLEQNKYAGILNSAAAANSQNYLARADTSENFELTDPAVAAAIKRNQAKKINEVAAALPADAVDFSAAAKGTKSKKFKAMLASDAFESPEDFQLTDRRLAMLDTSLPQRYKWRLSRARDDEFDVYRTPASSAFV